jgi:ferredoxin
MGNWAGEFWLWVRSILAESYWTCGHNTPFAHVRKLQQSVRILLMAFQVLVQPSGRQFETDADETILAAGIRQGVAMPYGCKDGACGSCKCKKLSGIVTHGQHQEKALSAQEEADGFILTCCGTAQSDLVLESRQVVSADAFPIKKMPVRVAALSKSSPDVMVIHLQLPAGEAMQYHAGQYVDFLLRDGSRRSYSMANAPSHMPLEGNSIELHIRHMPGGKFTDHVFGAMKEKEIQRIEVSSCAKVKNRWCSWLRAQALRRSRPSSSTCSTKASIAQPSFIGEVAVRKTCIKMSGSSRNSKKCRICAMSQ